MKLVSLFMLGGLVTAIVSQADEAGDKISRVYSVYGHDAEGTPLKKIRLVVDFENPIKMMKYISGKDSESAEMAAYASVRLVNETDKAYRCKAEINFVGVTSGVTIDKQNFDILDLKNNQEEISSSSVHTIPIDVTVEPGTSAMPMIESSDVSMKVENSTNAEGNTVETLKTQRTIYAVSGLMKIFSGSVPIKNAVTVKGTAFHIAGWSLPEPKKDAEWGYSGFLSMKQCDELK